MISKSHRYCAVAPTLSEARQRLFVKIGGRRLKGSILQNKAPRNYPAVLLTYTDLRKVVKLDTNALVSKNVSSMSRHEPAHLAHHFQYNKMLRTLSYGPKFKKLKLKFRQLKSLSIQNIQLSRIDLQHIARQKLECFKLWQCLPSNNPGRIISLLRNNPNLITLKLLDDKINDYLIKIFAENLPNNANLRFLKIFAPMVSTIGLEELARALAKHLNLRALVMEGEESINITPVLEALTYNKNVAKLALTSYKTDEQGLQFVTQSLNQLTTLKLIDCGIGDRQLIKLTDALTDNTNLRTLDLSNNPITDLKGLGKVLKNNKTLNNLIMFACSINNQSLKDLTVNLINNTSLKTLDLSNNDDISVDGIENITILLRKNHTIIKFLIGNEQIAKDQTLQIRKLLENNRKNRIKQVSLKL